MSAEAREVMRALDSMPSAPFVMTACYEDDRVGVLIEWVQRCCADPPLVSAVLRRGHLIEPIIRDSRAFALCKTPNDRLCLKRFGPDASPDADAFDSMEIETLVTGAPCLVRAESVFDCELHQHYDLDCDYEMYIGVVRAVRVREAPTRPKSRRK